MLPHLDSGWAVDQVPSRCSLFRCRCLNFEHDERLCIPQAILSEEERVAVIRFGHDDDETCMLMDEVLYSIADDTKNFATYYLVCSFILT